MPFTDISFFSSGGRFCQMFYAILMDGNIRNFFVKLFLKLGHWFRRRCSLRVFLFLALVAILFSQVVCAILVKSIMRKISDNVFPKI